MKKYQNEVFIKMISLVAILIVLILGYLFVNSMNKENYDGEIDDQQDEDYIKSSYQEGDRGEYNDEEEWVKQHNDSNNIVNDEHKKTPIENVTAATEFGDSEFSAFVDDGGKKLDPSNPENLYKVDNYLPQETNDNWFDSVKEPIPIKNRHLINTTRTIGLDTIGSSRKNSTRDLRGEPPNPKFVVSPFLNSSIEPQMSNRGVFQEYTSNVFAH